ncbi:MAG TPA: cyclase family protein [Blastocatellia bacterium]|nr:cyclase family protein [Blastocatellia bacterium]
MKTKLLLYALLGCVLISGCSTKQDAPPAGAGTAGAFPAGEWIDLSHAFSSETIYWPTAQAFKKETVAEGMTEQGYYYSAYNFSAAEHGGTHLDSPMHFAQGRNSVEKIPLSQTIGAAIKIDVSAKASVDRDYMVTVADFESWESQHGRIPDGAIVLLQTGWARHWPDRLKYLGTDKLGEAGVAELHFPGLAPDAAKWLVESRRINAIGLDTPSIDYGQSKLFESHRVLMDKNIPAFENVASLERIPATGAFVVALPMKIGGGSGAPLRIVALVPGR